MAGSGRQRSARIDLDAWQFPPHRPGRPADHRQWTWEEFQKLPRIRVFADFHCVTRWSRLGNLWEGVSTRELVAQARAACCPKRASSWSTAMTAAGPPTCRWTIFWRRMRWWPLLHDGEPLTVEHGGPARLIVPRLYAWKSAKWIAGIEFMDHDRPGFWEKNGYHMHGDPWREERFGL